MAKKTTNQAQIDPDIKTRAQDLFDLKIPNDLTSEALQDSEDGKELHRVASKKRLFQKLDR